MPGLVPGAYLCSFVTTFFTPVLHTMEPTRRRLPQSDGQQSVELGSDGGSLAPKSGVDSSASSVPHFISTAALSVRYSAYAHFPDEGSEIYKGEVIVSRSYSK